MTLINTLFRRRRYGPTSVQQAMDRRGIDCVTCFLPPIAPTCRLTNPIGLSVRPGVRGFPCLIPLVFLSETPFNLFFILHCLGTGCWNCPSLSLPMPCLQVLAFLFSSAASLGSLSLSTASVITSQLFHGYWFGHHLGDQWNLSNRNLRFMSNFFSFV